MRVILKPWGDEAINGIAEVDEGRAIQLPADLLAIVKPHTRFGL